MMANTEPITQPLGADVKPMDYSEIKMKTQREIYGEQKLESITQPLGADVKPRDNSEYKRKRQREIYGEQMLGFSEIVQQYKLAVKQKYESEWSFVSGKQESFADLFIEPVIIQKNENDVFKNISVSEIFQFCDPVSVILQGNTGSGKSFIAQKIMLDWASERLHWCFDLVFYLRCEELMCISEEMNLIDLLSYSCSLTSDQISKMLQQSPEKVLFIIDGFDELRLTEHIYGMSANTDLLQKAPPEVILCGLIRRYLISESTLLVTTRTKNTVNKLLNGQKRFSEIMGFSASQVDGYFQKFFRTEYDCVKANKSLFTACSIPVICRIISEMFRVGADVTSGLETNTSIYVDFVCTLLEHHCQGLSQSVPTLLRSLGQLAERGMLEQQVLLDEKTVNETVSVPYPFLSKFLIKRMIHQETMFSFMHLSFQEFFTALYCVLLDEEESQRKVRELLHTVERGWALSCWSDKDFSKADVEVRRAKFLQPVILFLCGLCNTEWIHSFFKKHNMTVSINIETQLKEWLNLCSKRYQNEHMLFILHCLYELHEKSFIGNVLQGLNLIDLSNIPLKRTDCWVLKYCLQCCEHIRNLKLHVTSEDLKMLQPELFLCKELWLMVDCISDDVVGLISAAGKGKILNKLNIKKPEIREKVFFPEITVSVRDEDIMLSFGRSVFASSNTKLTLTCPSSVFSTIKWFVELYIYQFGDLRKMELGLFNFLKSMFDLKKVFMQFYECPMPGFASEIQSLIQACPSLTEVRIKISEKSQTFLKPLKESLKQMGWTLTVRGNSVLINPDGKSFTVENLKMKREKSERRKGESSAGSCSLKAELSEQSSSDNADVFTPELLQEDDEEKRKNTYRFVCPHAGQFRCSLTSLVFVMEGEGEVLYKTVSWDPRVLDGLGQIQPAGPLYDIDCFHGSVSQLHCPHCEIFSEENKDGLAVAHFVGGNVEIIQPLKVTETHVVIEIRELSSYGLVWIKSILGIPIRGQVLLFLRNLTLERKQLNVHLLPGNVPVSEVQSRHRDKKYVETSSKCHLIAYQKYSLCCQPEECEVQPLTEMFEFDNFGQNYHPTFEVFLDVNIKEVRLGILDKTKGGKEVWNRRRIFLTAPSKAEEPSEHRRISETEFVNTHGDELIQRVSSVMAIADSLKSKHMITNEMWRKINAAEPQQKMRLLLEALDSGGASVKAEFYKLLKENEPFLVDDLESGHSGSSPHAESKLEA
ncbi:NACHT, LRR and PYD domains-containing protein 1 homolog isoform X1 [Pimephales promelas]|uniref:NACHT, LRR and PYD domains-containing protein 1 homolog isoform X1 n=1 Tax=Pimephales promelas TaxID=90988 RepID=UPI0019558786|nr:NACHT, LRR and PYD domains-containing protein 1 homolog isoform X1 [Pimephales promelas]